MSMEMCIDIGDGKMVRKVIFSEFDFLLDVTSSLDRAIGWKIEVWTRLMTIGS